MVSLARHSAGGRSLDEDREVMYLGWETFSLDEGHAKGQKISDVRFNKFILEGNVTR